MKFREFISIILIGTLIIFFLGSFVIMIFAEQDKNYNINSLTCNEIRECILLNIVCIESHTTNKLLGVTWDVKSKFASNQKDYYKIECLNNDADHAKVEGDKQ